MVTVPAEIKGNVLDPDCPSRQAVDLVLSKWAPQIIYVLRGGPRHFNQLRREIQGVSQKMLTQRLRELEEANLVTRSVLPTSPPKVEYALTPLGEDLIGPLTVIFSWMENHVAEMGMV